MLGVTPIRTDDPADDLLREFADHLGVADTYGKPSVGVYFGSRAWRSTTRSSAARARGAVAASPVASAWSAVLTARRTPSIKNYLWLAETRGARVLPIATVVDIRPLGAVRRLRRLRGGDRAHGSMAAPRPPDGPRGRRGRAAGPPGPTSCCSAAGTTARCQLSARLGELVRTNSEAILAVTARTTRRPTKRVAISGSIYPDENTHIETVSYGGAGDR